MIVMGEYVEICVFFSITDKIQGVHSILKTLL